MLLRDQAALDRLAERGLDQTEAVAAVDRAPAGVRRDLRKFLRGVSPRYTIEAAKRVQGFERPVLFVWAAEDKLFPLEDARRLASELPDARIEEIDDSYAFLPEDQPEQLADAIASFVREPAGVSA